MSAAASEPGLWSQGSTSSALRISYVFEQIPGDFVYFDVIWPCYSCLFCFCFLFFCRIFIFHFYLSFLDSPLVKPPWMPSASAFFIFAFACFCWFYAQEHYFEYQRLYDFSSFDVLLSFPHAPKSLIRYVAFLTLSGRSYGTIVNRISNLNPFLSQFS